MFMHDDTSTFFGEWPLKHDTSDFIEIDQLGFNFLWHMNDIVDWAVIDNERSPLNVIFNPVLRNYVTWEPDFIWGLADDP